MQRKMFGHHMKKHAVTRHLRKEMDEDNPPGYEGKEHVSYEDPGYSSHHIRYPEDEPHMKSHVHQEEEHEAEDNYHMGVPDQTEDELPAHLKRAHMLMDAPNQQDPKPLRGNITHNVPYKGEEDTSGEEMMGPNSMQESGKEKRKKLVVAVMKRKMHRQHSGSDSRGRQ
jgi:hypothetical protein